MADEDIFFNELTRNFHSQYDFFKDIPWFDLLKHHVNSNFYYEEGESILDIIAIVLVISYVNVKRLNDDK